MTREVIMRASSLTRAHATSLARIPCGVTVMPRMTRFRGSLRLTVCLLMSLISLNCTDNEVIAPPSPPRIDPRLFGEWYAFRHIDYPYPAPRQQVFGFQLTACSTWNHLAVRVNTGALAYYNTPYVDSVVSIGPDTITLYQYRPYTGYSVVNIPYAFSGDALVLYNEERFIKSRINAVVTGPVPTMLRATVDGEVVEAAEVWFWPSAFASRVRTPAQEFSLLLESTFTGTKNLFIRLRHFTGEGEYELGSSATPGSYALLAWGDEDPTRYVTTDSSHVGRCVITRYDTTTGRCSGTFEFWGTSWPVPTITMEITDGMFDVKLYK